MESVHGVDVSWMTHGSPKDKSTKSNPSPPAPPAKPPAPESPRSSPQPAGTRPNDQAAQQRNASANANGNPPTPQTNGTATANGQQEAPATPAKPVPAPRPSLKRGDSNEKPGPNGTPPSRRGSWFSNISSKFSSSQHHAGNANPNGNNNGGPNSNGPSPSARDPIGTQSKEAEPAAPKLVPNKNAVLAHAAKADGDQPYIPAPPSRSPSSFLGVFRRLSSSGGALSPGQKGNHGLVKRKVLNVDHNRERCGIAELKQSKLRRVAFSVDVEIAPMPRYTDSDGPSKPLAEKAQQRKMAEKGEGEALKNPKTLEDQKETEGVVKATGEAVPKEPEKEGTEVAKDSKAAEPPAKTTAEKEREAKKKEKKKKSEEERKARKEKKRKQAEANGTIPMEIHVDDSDSSSADTSGPATGGIATPKTTSVPTTNPVRIYRRCCQLRETPILKRITEQLTNPANCSDATTVDKIDLTGYWLQLPDLITLGDYLAVVPVKEIVLENCGLSDEGLRVILAGLLAARKPESRKRRANAQPDGLSAQGGVVERLVLKNNKLGFDGWKYVCLFIYLCRTLKHLDLSMVALPRHPPPKSQNGQKPLNLVNQISAHDGIMLATLLSKAVGQRLAGSTLELLHIGAIKPTSEELGIIVDGIIECGVKRLSVAHNDLDEKGFEHVARFFSSGHCEGLDLGGNDLRDHMDILAQAIPATCPLWGLSLAECNLRPASLRQFFPKLVPLPDFRFIDLSHNRDLCGSEPSVIGLLRKYLPKLQHLKRVHLADIAMTSEQAIALAEILPEIPGLAHISLLENPELVKLTDAKTEEVQEEACALYASLLAATRVSTTLVCLDIDVPSERSGEIVKAMAKQVVAYCLRNLQRFPIAEISSAVQALSDSKDLTGSSEPPYPDVLVHLVGHDVLDENEPADGDESTPDENYVIGGTGVVKALTCCLKNRGDETRRLSIEGDRSTPATPTTRPKLPPGKAKDMSKHLLAGARKIRVRLQPAIAKAKENPEEEEANLRKLMFLDTTLENIIKRFEDEFPDTRVAADHEVGSLSLASDPSAPASASTANQLGTSFSSAELDPEQIAIPSDPEDELDLAVRPRLSRTNSALSHTSRALAEEEGRMLRAGHKFRSAIVKPEYFDLLNGFDEATIDPKQAKSIHDMIDELNDADLSRKMQDKGVTRLFREDQQEVREALRRLDPEYWERFVESQEKARGNVQAAAAGAPGAGPAAAAAAAAAAPAGHGGGAAQNESAVED